MQDLKRQILEGKIFIYPTDTVYGLGCNAFDEISVNKIKRIKKREDMKHFSVIAPSKEWILNNFEVEELFKVVFLPEGITISSLTAKPTASPPEAKNEIEITFSPPNPDVYLRGDGVFGYENAQITLTDGVQSKVITVTSQGLVE